MVAPQTGLRNRVRQIPDGLAHLNSGISNDRSTNMSHLRGIACALVRIDAWALNTIRHSYAANPQIVGLYFYTEFKALVSENTRNLGDYNDIYEDRFENDVQNSLEELSDDKILEILCDLHTSTYYAQFIHLRTLLHETVWIEYNYATKAPNLTVPEDWLGTPQQYLKRIAREVSENMVKLRAVLMGCRALRDRIKHAAELGEIAPVTLAALKKKLEALQLNFCQACINVGINSDVLINPNIEQWWSPGDEATQVKSLESSPSSVVEAYPNFRSVSSTLSFLVPTICLLSCIPTGLAWWYTPSQVGAYNDGDFHQLISSSAMQLLGTGTLLWPTLFSKRLGGLPWIWTWVLAGTSIICTLVSIPLYLIVPTTWSGLLSFCANVTQALALLQLVHCL